MAVLVLVLVLVLVFVPSREAPCWCSAFSSASFAVILQQHLQIHTQLGWAVTVAIKLAVLCTVPTHFYHNMVF